MCLTLLLSSLDVEHPFSLPREHLLAIVSWRISMTPYWSEIVPVREISFNYGLLRNSPGIWGFSSTKTPGDKAKLSMMDARHVPSAVIRLSHINGCLILFLKGLTVNCLMIVKPQSACSRPSFNIATKNFYQRFFITVFISARKAGKKLLIRYGNRRWH